jgi:flagellar motor switch protein FliN
MNPTLVEALGQELATIVGAMAGDAATASAAAGPVTTDGWTALVDTDSPARGAWTVVIDGAGARALTAAIMGLTDDVPAESVADTLRETLIQALSALSSQDVAGGVKFRVSEVTSRPAATPAEPVVTLSVSCAASPVPLLVSVTGEIDVTVVVPSASARPAGIGERQFVIGEAAAADPAAGGSERLDAILDIELPLVVRFGRTELPLRALAHLGPGSLIDLGRSADDPVDLLVSNRVVARGEVVVVGGNYGVRVLDVVSPRDRVRPMEA